jgi:hypothetical protein
MKADAACGLGSIVVTHSAMLSVTMTTRMPMNQKIMKDQKLVCSPTMKYTGIENSSVRNSVRGSSETILPTWYGDTLPTKRWDRDEIGKG